MKKVPLYFGLFLIVVWGAHQKVAPSLAGKNKTKQTPDLVITYSERLDQSLDSSTLNWAEFHRIYHPQFSDLTDEALYQLYKELKK